MQPHGTDEFVAIPVVTMAAARELPTAAIKHTCWNASVYEPSDDSFLLVDALQAHAPVWASKRPKTVLEVGCGSGYVICSLALLLKALGLSCQLLAVDINPEATAAASKTLANHGVTDVELLVSDLLGGLQRLKGQVDVLVFNPPYVPTPDEEVTRPGIARAWAGGHRGRIVIDRLLEQVPDLLSEQGEMFMVTVAENDPAGIIADMQAKGFSGTAVMARQADEETLSILHLQRIGSGPS